MTIEDTLRQIVREEVEAALAEYRAPAVPTSQRPDMYVPLVLSVKVAAEYLGIHDNTVRVALEDGTLHGFQRSKGAHWHIQRACLDAWISGERCEHQRPDGTVTSFARTPPGVRSRP